jgi:hypothetical protein
VIAKTKPIYEKNQQNIPIKDRKIRYNYAPLDVVVEQIKSPLSDNGLSYMWKNEQGQMKVTVTCIVTHILGHSETSSSEIPVTTSDFMTLIQSYASDLTFGKRYTLMNVLGVTAGGEDNESSLEEQTKENVTKTAYILMKEKIQNATPEELPKKIAVIEKELALIANKKAPSLGLNETQYNELLSIAKSRVGAIDSGLADLPDIA